MLRPVAVARFLATDIVIPLPDKLPEALPFPGGAICLPPDRGLGATCKDLTILLPAPLLGAGCLTSYPALMTTSRTQARQRFRAFPLDGALLFFQPATGASLRVRNTRTHRAPTPGTARGDVRYHESVQFDAVTFVRETALARAIGRCLKR